MSLNDQPEINETARQSFIQFIASIRSSRRTRDQLYRILNFEPLERRVVLSALLGTVSRGVDSEEALVPLQMLLRDEMADRAREMLFMQSRASTGLMRERLN